MHIQHKQHPLCVFYSVYQGWTSWLYDLREFEMLLKLLV